MFLFSWRGVVFAVVLFALFGYLSLTGRYGAARPWIDAAGAIYIAVMVLRSWFG